jgi:P-type Mg2+ transporter
MALAAVGIVALGAVLPYTGHLAHVLGFRPLPGTFFLALAGIVVVYLVLVEVGKYWFYRLYHAPATPAPRHRGHGYRVRRRAARFAVHTLRPVHWHNASQDTPVRQDSKVPAG